VIHGYPRDVNDANTLGALRAKVELLERELARVRTHVMAKDSLRETRRKRWQTLWSGIVEWVRREWWTSDGDG
jgi:hypothetical protein